MRMFQTLLNLISFLHNLEPRRSDEDPTSVPDSAVRCFASNNLVTYMFDRARYGNGRWKYSTVALFI